MIYINENKKNELSKRKVTFSKNGVTEEKLIGSEGENWWNNLANIHDSIKIIEILDVVYTAEEIQRFEEVKEFNSFLDEVEEYILTGNINVFKKINDSKIENFVLKKELEATQSAIDFLIMGGM